MSLPVNALVTVCAVSTLALHVDHAHACTAPFPSVLSRHVYPADGEADVALDARVIVHVDAQNLRGGMQPVDAEAFLAAADIALETASGDEVPTDVEAFQNESGLTLFFTPKTPLMADTEYVVTDKIAIGSATLMSPTLPFLDTAFEVARFTTGTTVAGAAPRAVGVVVGQESFQSCDNSACCGPYEAAAMTLTFDPPGPGLLARIEREVDGAFVPVAWVEAGYASGWASCSGGWSPSPDFFGAGTYRVRFEGPSVALGEPSEPVTLVGDCSAPEPTGPTGPTEPQPEDRTEEMANDPGCSGGTFGLWALLGLGLVATNAVSLARSGPLRRGSQAG